MMNSTSDKSWNTSKKNGAIASLVLPRSSTPSAGPSPSTSFSPPVSPAHQSNGKITPSRTFFKSPYQHYHLPSYRFVDEDPRAKSSLSSAIDCQRCGRKRRDPTWLEIQAVYDMIDGQQDTEKHRYHMESVAERRRNYETAARLQEANKQLDRLLDELEAFSTSSSTAAASRSKSTPDFNYINERTHPSTPVDEIQSMTPLPNRFFYNLKKEEMLRRARAEQHAHEIENQRNRRHGYIPNLSPSLQNDFGRLEQLLNDFKPREPNGRNGRSRSLSTRIPVLTCTAIYKFSAQSPRELSLEIGDMVYVRRRINDDWVEGERNGFIGVFPVSYVRFNV